MCAMISAVSKDFHVMWGTGSPAVAIEHCHNPHTRPDALVYIMAAPLAQPDMVDFYRMYRPGALIFLLGLFIIQFVFGVAAVYRGK